jgi:hypothetical protein
MRTRASDGPFEASARSSARTPAVVKDRETADAVSTAEASGVEAAANAGNEADVLVPLAKQAESIGGKEPAKLAWDSAVPFAPADGGSSLTKFGATGGTDLSGRNTMIKGAGLVLLARDDYLQIGTSTRVTLTDVERVTYQRGSQSWSGFNSWSATSSGGATINAVIWLSEEGERDHVGSTELKDSTVDTAASAGQSGSQARTTAVGADGAPDSRIESDIAAASSRAGESSAASRSAAGDVDATGRPTRRSYRGYDRTGK